MIAGPAAAPPRVAAGAWGCCILMLGPVSGEDSERRQRGQARAGSQGLLAGAASQTVHAKQSERTNRQEGCCCQAANHLAQPTHGRVSCNNPNQPGQATPNAAARLTQQSLPCLQRPEAAGWTLLPLPPPLPLQFPLPLPHALLARLHRP